MATDGAITVAAGASLDFETTASYSLTAVATNAAGDSASVSVIITVTNVVEVANFTINAIANAVVVEGATYNGPAAVTSGDDPIGEVTYSLGGADALDFIIDDATGEVSMTAPGFDTTNDADGDYVYEVSITATDADGNNATEAWTVTVTHTDGYRVISYNTGSDIQLWLDRNLGANSKCTTIRPNLDNNCMGDYYQWGRKKDGHENNSTGPTTNVLSLDSAPTHSDFIRTDDDTDNNPSLNWIDHNEPGLWQDDNINAVCPAGWHVPSKGEFSALAASNATDAFDRINLHTSSYRDDSDGLIDHSRTFGFYWTSTVTENNDSTSFRMTRNPDADPETDSVRFSDYGRANGFQVRCIKN